MELELRCFSRKIVKPAVPSKLVAVELSNIDQISPPMHMPYLWFYQHNGAPSYMASSMLEESLEQLLVEFYPLAGRFKIQDGRFFIQCNDEGVEFVEALATGTLSDFGGDFGALHSLGILNPCCVYGEHSSMPIMLIQVTRFECGGVALAVAISHKVADLYSCELFMEKWTGASTLPVTYFMHPKLLPSSGLPSSIRALQKFPELTSSAVVTESFVKVFKFSSNMVDCLRQRDSTGVKRTKFELLTGFMWSSIAKAKSLDSSSITVAINLRRRLAFSDGLFGNVILQSSATASVPDLVPQLGAKLVHEAVLSVDRASLQSRIDRIQTGAVTYCVEESSLVVSSWRNSSLGCIDFGFGPPIFVALAIPSYQGPNPVLIVLPKCSLDLEVIKIGAWGLKPEEIAQVESELSSLSS